MKEPGPKGAGDTGSPRSGADRAYAAAILDAALDAVITIDHRGKVLEFNRAAESTFGYEREKVVGRELAELIVPPESREAHRRALARWTEEGPGPGAGSLLGRTLEVRAMRAGGELFPAELAISRVDLPGPPLFTACIRDISERRAAEEQLRATQSRFRTLVEQLPLAVYIDAVDEVSSNIYTSPQLEPMLGYTVDEWQSDPLLFVRTLHPDDRERALAAHAHTHSTREPLSIDYRLIARDGRVIWVHDEARVVDGVGGPPVLQGYLLDITERRAMDELLRQQAFQDPLTGLANRALFADRVQHALELREKSGGQTAVLFLDIDDFKRVNDTLGHPAGDTLLCEAGARLRAALSPSHTVARLGGDEFAILVEEDLEPAAVADIAERLLTSLQAPFSIQESELFVTASVGIAVGDDVEELLRSADVAMYRAKASGKAQHRFYNPTMDEALLGRLELIADLRQADLAEELVLHYQPAVDLRTSAIVGVEALVRWQHPTRGLLAPGEFIPAAEETLLIDGIGRWVLEEACRRAARWRQELGDRAPEMSVNVSARQLERAVLVDDVSAVLQESGLDPSDLTLEITESALAHGHDEARAGVRALQELGVRLALDDFGSGYSSLSLLQELPVDILKVDRSFVEGIETTGRRTALLRAIVEIARALGLVVVAEGVENARQAAALRRLGCPLAQGFYFARPLPEAEIDALLRVSERQADSPAA